MVSNVISIAERNKNIEMALYDSCSPICHKSELDFFSPRMTQTSITETRFEPFFPLTSLDGNGPIEFRVNVGMDEMIDPSETLLYTKSRILTWDGKALEKPAAAPAGPVPNKSKVYPVNYYNASAFRQVEVMLNSTPLPPVSLYQYKGYLETLLTFSPAVKKSQLEGAFWMEDKGSDIDQSDPTADDATNKGAKRRWNETKYSKSFECLGRIHHELFEQPDLLLNKMTLGLRFHRSDTNFSLISMTPAENYKIEIEQAVLIVMVKKIASDLREALETRLMEGEKVKYVLRHVDMKFFTKGSERADISIPNLCSGVLPSKIVFGLVETNAFNGNLNKNPFNFKPFNLIEMSLQKSGMDIPFKPLKVNFDKDEPSVLMGYFQLMHSIGMYNTNKTNGLKIRDDYCGAKNLYAVNLSQDFSHGNSHLNLLEEGSLGLTLRLKEGLNTSVTVVVYMVYPSATLEINQQREIFYNE